MELKQIAVFGATGQQGGAVAAALEARGNVQIVAITRNPDSTKAQELAARPNTTVRQADLNDTSSLIAALEGCDGAFVIANFWETMDAGKEMEQYKNVTDALKQVGTVKHVIFSTLEETAKTDYSKDFKVIERHETGDMTVPHFDGKARAEAYFEGLPTTFMVTSCYFENFGSFFSFVQQDDGSYLYTLPMGDDKPIPWTILPDLGVLCAQAFGKDELVGQRMGQASFLATGDELAAIFSKVTGKTIQYNCVTWQTFASFGFPGADELAQMFEFWLRTLDDFCKARDLDAQLTIMGDGAKFTDPVEYGKTLTLKFE